MIRVQCLADAPSHSPVAYQHHMRVQPLGLTLVGQLRTPVSGALYDPPATARRQSLAEPSQRLDREEEKRVDRDRDDRRGNDEIPRLGGKNSQRPPKRE